MRVAGSEVARLHGAAELGRVLLLGKDEAQLDVYAAVLRHFWPVQTLVVKHGDPLPHAMDVVVVCSTLPEPERQHLIDAVRAAHPAMLVVRVNGFDSGPHAGADATVDETHGPGALVSTIYELLTERGLASLRWPLPGEVAWVQ
jgi:hypothetical protein